MEQVLIEHVVGSILGTMLGDALGLGCEMWPCADLNVYLDQVAAGNRDAQFEKFARLVGPIAGVIVDGDCRYSDDTEMTLGIAESLVECGRVDPQALARRFAANFNPARGYGVGAYGVLTALRAGAAWDAPGRAVFGGSGSFGNGAAMRAAPIGLWLHDAAPAELRDAARLSALPTHTHRLGIEGAVWQATAAASALRAGLSGKSGGFDAERFLDDLGEAIREPEFVARLQSIRRLVDGPALPYCDAAECFGNGIAAQDSAPLAAYAFLKHPDSFADAVTYAIRCGGDTDTIGAMCGALSGAYLGESAVPQDWRRAIEDGPRGITYARDIAVRFAGMKDSVDPPT